MSEPLIVKIPHKLGKEEALRRIKPALGKASSSFPMLVGGGGGSEVASRGTARVHIMEGAHVCPIPASNNQTDAHYSLHDRTVAP
jgi:hypothetical protein